MDAGHWTLIDGLHYDKATRSDDDAGCCPAPVLLACLLVLAVLAVLAMQRRNGHSHGHGHGTRRLLAQQPEPAAWQQAASSKQHCWFLFVSGPVCV